MFAGCILETGTTGTMEAFGITDLSFVGETFFWEDPDSLGLPIIPKLRIYVAIFVESLSWLGELLPRAGTIWRVYLVVGLAMLLLAWNAWDGYCAFIFVGEWLSNLGNAFYYGKWDLSCSIRKEVECHGHNPLPYPIPRNGIDCLKRWAGVR